MGLRATINKSRAGEEVPDFLYASPPALATGREPRQAAFALTWPKPQGRCQSEANHRLQHPGVPRLGWGCKKNCGVPARRGDLRPGGRVRARPLHPEGQREV